MLPRYCPRWWCKNTLDGQACRRCGWSIGKPYKRPYDRDIEALRRCHGAEASALAFEMPPVGRYVREIGYCSVARVLGWAAGDPDEMYNLSRSHDCPDCRCDDPVRLPRNLGWWRLQRDGEIPYDYPPWCFELVEPVGDVVISHAVAQRENCPRWCSGCRYEERTKNDESAAEAAAYGC